MPEVIEQDQIRPGANILGGASFEEALQDVNLPSAYKDLVHPGDNIKDLLMRTCFKDEEQADAAIEYYARCVEFEDQEGKDKLLWKLASAVSVDGRARKELIMAMAGLMNATIYGKKPKDMAGKNGVKPNEL